MVLNVWETYSIFLYQLIKKKKKLDIMYKSFSRKLWKVEKEG